MLSFILPLTYYGKKPKNKQTNLDIFTRFTVASEELPCVQTVVPESNVCAVCCNPAVEARLEENVIDPAIQHSLEDTKQ